MARHIETGRLGDSRTKVRSLEVVEPRKKKSIPKRPPQRVVEKRLSPLEQRKKERQDASVEARTGLTGIRLLNAFIDTNDFQRFYEIAVKESLKGASWDEDYPKFRGALFQAVVLEHLKKTQLDSAQVLLIGKDVTKFSLIVNPGKTIIDHPYNQQGIDHRYVPDFLVLGLNNGKVGIDEYGEISLSSDPDKYMPQLSGFLHEKSRLGSLMKEARFRIITPDIGTPLAMQVVPGIEHVDTDIIPFTYPEFSNFAQGVNVDYRKTPEGLTLNQIRREAQSRIGEPQFYRQ